MMTYAEPFSLCFTHCAAPNAPDRTVELRIHIAIIGRMRGSEQLAFLFLRLLRGRAVDGVERDGRHDAIALSIGMQAVVG